MEGDVSQQASASVPSYGAATVHRSTGVVRAAPSSIEGSTAKLLRAASEIVGGSERLVERFGISQTLLGKFMDGTLRMPDWLLLQAVDIVLAEREALQNTSKPPG